MLGGALEQSPDSHRPLEEGGGTVFSSMSLIFFFHFALLPSFTFFFR